MAIIAEAGLDMSVFPTAGPPGVLGRAGAGARQSGPRSRKPAKGQGDAYLRGYCTQAANGAAGTDTFLGERLARLSRRIGGARARCAVGRSVLVIIWHLLSDPAADTPTWAPAGTSARPTATRKSRATSASSRPSASPSPSPKQPPKPKTLPDQARFPTPRALKPCPRLVANSHGSYLVVVMIRCRRRYVRCAACRAGTGAGSW